MSLEQISFTPNSWGCEPGRSIFMNSEPLFAITMYHKMMEELRFRKGAQLYTYCTSVYPFPDLDDLPYTQPLARQVGNLTHIGLPILWLKGDIFDKMTVVETERVQVEDEYRWIPNGESHIESQYEIVARIAAWMEFTNIYDANSGEWVDVVRDIMGLDVNDPATQSRIRRWQDGAPDKLFDGFDLAAHMESIQPKIDVVSFVEWVVWPSIVVSALEPTLQFIAMLEDEESTRDEKKLQVILQHTGFVLDVYTIYLTTGPEELEQLRQLVLKINNIYDSVVDECDLLIYRYQALELAYRLTTPHLPMARESLGILMASREYLANF